MNNQRNSQLGDYDEDIILGCDYDSPRHVSFIITNSL